MRRLLLALVCLAATAALAQDEVPFITSPDRVTLAMLDLAQVGPSDHVIDLGSGDGRIVITAARRHGASGLGVEIVPALVAKSRDNARAAGVAARAEFREQDLFTTDLARATVVTLYLLPEINLQLRPRLLALAPGTRVVSHDWDMGDWTPDRSVTLDVPDKTIGRDKRSTVHLWTVPARVDGLWCAPQGASLRVAQRFAQFSAELRSAARADAPAMVFDGRIAARRLQANHPHTAELLAEGDGALRVLRIGAPGVAVADAVFTRAGAAGCR
jgi:SAM-dependent methyltransferase